MREIKFRGRRKSDGTWLYGSLVITHFRDDREPRYFIVQFAGQYSFDHEVIPETVGQYTGLKDKNGKEIYEGDICQVIVEYGEYEEDRLSLTVAVAEIEVWGAWFKWQIKDEDGETIDRRWDMGRTYQSGREVIGNIYENPELIPHSP